MNNVCNDLLEQVKAEIESNQGLFITGSAGTGKSTLIRQMKEDEFFKDDHDTIYLGSTGIAAYNINGSTLHSFFKLNPFASSLKNQIETSLRVLEKRRPINKKTLLIIDEISMVSNLLLDTIDFILREILIADKPFGGVKIIFVGDFLQLPPVYSAGECYPENIDEYYNNYNSYSIIGFDKIPLIPVKSCYLCSSWNNLNPKIIKLTTNHRFLNSKENQKIFINELLKLRKGNYDLEYWSKYNSNKKNNITYTKLTSLKKEAQNINETELNKLPGKIYNIKYGVEKNGKINSDLLAPLDVYKNLTLKKGAKIILTKNLSVLEGLVNGSVGKILDIKYKGDVIEDQSAVVLDVIKNKVQLEIDFGEDTGIKIIEAQPFFINIVESFNQIDQEQENTEKKEEQEKRKKNTVTVKYFPILLAWAITIHKSQGLTLKAVYLRGVNIFAPHQLYVALSRVKNPENLYIESLPVKIPPVEPELLDLYL